jgi:hypothetical protein
LELTTTAITDRTLDKPIANPLDKPIAATALVSPATFLFIKTQPFHATASYCAHNGCGDSANMSDTHRDRELYRQRLDVRLYFGLFK